MSIDAYLERIGFSGAREPSVANLAALVRAHRLSVPYETLDLWRGRLTTLAAEELYDKIVRRRRGGYCLELNGLFAWLLRALGYDVTECLGRWHYQEPEEIPPQRHRVLCVAFRDGSELFVDVGVGVPCFFAPLALNAASVQTAGGANYRILSDPRLGTVVEVLLQNGKWARLVSFFRTPCEVQDFAAAHWWCQTHPESEFRRRFAVYLPLADGREKFIVCANDPESAVQTPVLKRRRSDGGEETPVWLRDEAALATALRDEFALVE